MLARAATRCKNYLEERCPKLALCENSYRPLFELVRDAFEVIAQEAPDMLALLREQSRSGRIELIGSPFIHVMLTNIPSEAWLLRPGLDTWEKYPRVRPSIGCPPECGWASFLTELYQEADFQSIVIEESFFLSFPEIREAIELSCGVQGGTETKAPVQNQRARINRKYFDEA